MQSNQNEQAAVFFTAENQVEIIPSGAIRKLISTPTQHQLVIIDERNQPVIYLLEAKAFVDEYVADYGKSANKATHLTFVASALFQAVLEGKTFKVLSKRAANPTDLA